VTADPLTVVDGLDAIVRPIVWRTEEVRVATMASSMDPAIRETCAALQRSGERPDVVTAVRTMYKRLGIDPTKTRPSSEALLRRVRRGDAFPRVNSLVDVINWTSLETHLSFGVYDAGHIVGAMTLRRGREDEEYAGIRKDAVHVAGRIVLADELGAFGNPTSDSARTMVTTGTREAVVVIYAPVGLDPGIGAWARQLTEQRIGRYCRTVE
jgi:DNA/RNA-binding domain of Phe-tRNA-synthetase-like protein